MIIQIKLKDVDIKVCGSTVFRPPHTAYEFLRFTSYSIIVLFLAVPISNFFAFFFFQGLTFLSP